MYKLVKANNKSIKYACLNYHYAKSIPVNTFGYNVYFDKEYCGVILFGTGATPNIAKPYNLLQGEVIELVRVALNGKQNEVSKPLSIALKLIKKDCPLVKMIVSYADIDQNHKGIIYKATNWIYDGICNENTRTGFIINGKKTHNKSVYGKGVKQSLSEVKKHLDSDAVEFISKGKIKYLYFLDDVVKYKYHAKLENVVSRINSIDKKAVQV